MNKYLMEVVGTFFLVLTIGCTVIGNGAGPLAPLAIGGVLMVMIFAGGHISGAHYNPAVSTAVMVRGKLAQNEFIAYAGVQLIAGVIAAAIARVVLGHSDHAGPVAAVGKEFIVEFLFTFALAYVVV